MKNRVAVTGVGLISCVGNSYEKALAELKRGGSGVRLVPGWQEHGLKSQVAGTIQGLEDKRETAHLSKKLIPGMSDAALYCSLAALDAVDDAALAKPELEDPGTGCIVGSGTSSVDSVYRSGALYYSGRSRRIDPYTVLRSMSSSTSSAVSNLLKIRGRSYSLSSACATSTHNIGHAYELIATGALGRAVTGGGEDVSELIAAAFQSMRLALSTRYNNTPEKASRPYDAQRDGFVLSGGSGIVVLEELEAARMRGARVRAEIIGYGANSDAHDLVLPRPGGEQAAECMRAALADADIQPQEVEYVNTHGTSTVDGDLAEIEAMRQVFGKNMPPFSSTKSMTGHAIGAAGALELIFCVGMIEFGFLAPSINIETLDPAFSGLPIVTTSTPSRPAIILSNNFGFGGTNASLLIKRYDA